MKHRKALKSQAKGADLLASNRFFRRGTLVSVAVLAIARVFLGWPFTAFIDAALIVLLFSSSIYLVSKVKPRNEKESRPSKPARNNEAQAIEILGLRSILFPEFRWQKPSPSVDSAEEPRLIWILPGVGEGSGGQKTITNVIQTLELSGVRSVICVNSKLTISQLSHVRDHLLRSYPQNSVRVEEIENLQLSKNDTVVATHWTTYWTGKELATSFSSKFTYFVQDFEAFFYAPGTYSALAKSTLEDAQHIVALGTWLAKEVGKIAVKANISQLQLAVDKNIFFPPQNEETALLELTALLPEVAHFADTEAGNLIVAYVRPDTDRRGTDGVCLALQLAFEAGSAFSCVFVGAHIQPDIAGYRHFSAGKISERQLASLYRFASLGVVQSHTNPSLAPFEMAASGLQVIDIDTDSTSHDLAGDDLIRLAQPDPISFSSAISDALREKAKAKSRANNRAITTWASQTETIAQAFLRTPAPAAKSNKGRASTVRQLSLELTWPTVRVCLPTLNPSATQINELWENLDSQEYPGDFSVKIIDSSSDSFPNLPRSDRFDVEPVGVIAREDFRHGPSRNLFLNDTDAEILVFITQDALPGNSAWLTNLVRPFFGPHVLGAFSRHIAPDSASIFQKISLLRHFAHLDRHHPVEASAENLNLSAQRKKQIHHFFSNNSAAYKVEALREINFRNVGFGEDQLWAKDAIDHGGTIFYAKDSLIVHHNKFSLEDERETARTVAVWLAKYWNEDVGEFAERSLSGDMQRFRELSQSLRFPLRVREEILSSIRSRSEGHQLAKQDVSEENSYFQGL